MGDITLYIGYIFILFGSLFLILASLGLLRLPDTISRMHAGTKASTLGTLLVLIGIGFIEPVLWFKLLLLALFILLTNPLSSSIIAKSSYMKNGFYSKTKVDEMEDIK
ncbi:MAG: monovalent cation/H(+) antiporter subunit G [Campylobacterota bacterium]|nr:monovalent cation/H(+) antiporter subunit G [Campylobacterota bacterium]